MVSRTLSLRALRAVLVLAQRAKLVIQQLNKCIHYFYSISLVWYFIKRYSPINSILLVY